MSEKFSIYDNIDDFLVFIASEKGLSKNTIEAYRRDTLSFVKYLQKRKCSDFSSVEESHIIGFLKQMKDAGFATSSMTRALIAVKVLLRFLKREKTITKDIGKYMQTPKLWQLIPEVLSISQIEEMIAACDSNNATGARDKAILEVLYGCGLRVSEVCTLGFYDVDDTHIRVFGKGGKERIVPIGKKAMEAIDHYITNFRGNVDEKQRPPLFISAKGKAIDRILVWKMIKKVARLCSIQKPVSPHTLRHSFATHLLDNGADLRVIQELLGHAHIASTDRYTHVSRSHLKKAFDAFHPRKEFTHQGD